MYCPHFVHFFFFFLALNGIQANLSTSCKKFSLPGDKTSFDEFLSAFFEDNQVNSATSVSTTWCPNDEDLVTDDINRLKIWMTSQIRNGQQERREISEKLTGLTTIVQKMKKEVSGPKCKRGYMCVPIQDCTPKNVNQTGDQYVPGVGEKVIISKRSDTVLKVCCAAPAPPPSAPLPLECGRQPVPHRGIRTNSVPPFGSHPWIGAWEWANAGRTYFIPVIFISSTFVIIQTSLTPPKDAIISYGLSEYGADQNQQCVVLRREEECYERRKAGVKKEIKHPDNTTLISLYKLNRTVDFNDRSVFVEPTCLPTEDQSTPLEGHEALIVGMNWSSGQLRSVVVSVVDVEECKPSWKGHKETFWETKICARPIGPSVGGGFLPSFLLVWDESEPPIFTLVGVLRGYSYDRDWFLFNSMKESLLPWILNVTSGLS